QRVLTYEQIQLAENLLVASERKVAIDPVHQRHESQLVELRDLVASARLELEAGERGAAPEREGLLESVPGAVELTGRAVLRRARNEPLSAAGVEPLRLNLHAVTTGCGCDRISACAAERLAELRDIDVDRSARGRRRGLPPQVVNKALARDELVRMQEENAEDESLF